MQKRTNKMKSLEFLKSLEREFGSLQEVQIRALRSDSEFLVFLSQNPPPPTIKCGISKVDSTLIFEKETFLDFLKLRKLGKSYTKFTNKIGLTIHSHRATLLKNDSNVVLNFPYKDCILKGAQSKDSDKSDEIFFNEILEAMKLMCYLSQKYCKILSLSPLPCGWG